MKNVFKILIAAAFTAVAIPAGAQNYKVVATGDAVRSDGSREYVFPATTIVVGLQVKCESVQKGPYARYAQKYFGTIAPLADKAVYEIVSADIKYYDSGNVPAEIIEKLPDEKTAIQSHISSASGMRKVQVDKLSARGKTDEEAAADAAEAVFALRKRRTELVTGEFAETVFGEGLNAALRRIDKMENDYLELFYGRQTTTVSHVRYYITPESENTSYVICRFTDGQGIVAADNLSGRPVMLDLKPTKAVEEKFAEMRADAKRRKPKKDEPVVEAIYTVSDEVLCRVMDGGKVIGERTIPVLQYGLEVYLPVNP